MRVMDPPKARPRTARPSFGAELRALADQQEDLLRRREDLVRRHEELLALQERLQRREKDLLRRETALAERELGGIGGRAGAALAGILRGRALN